MNQNVRAIYEDGILRPLQPLDSPENKIVEIDVRDITENKEKETNKAFTKNNFCGKYDSAD